MSHHQELPASAGARIIRFPDRPRVAGPQLPPEILIGVRNPVVRDRVAAVLRELGGRPVRAGDGIRLVERIADVVLTGGPRPGLIIADAALPGCSGLALLASVRALHWTTPVIVLTRLDQVEERRAAWADGATGVFVAPLDLDQLRSFASMVLTTR